MLLVSRVETKQRGLEQDAILKNSDKRTTLVALYEDIGNVIDERALYQVDNIFPTWSCYGRLLVFTSKRETPLSDISSRAHLFDISCQLLHEEIDAAFFWIFFLSFEAVRNAVLLIFVGF
jgi:hypothetical protein